MPFLFGLYTFNILHRESSMAQASAVPIKPSAVGFGIYRRSPAFHANA